MNRTSTALSLTDDPFGGTGRDRPDGFSTRMLSPGERQTVTFDTPRLHRYASTSNAALGGVLEVVANEEQAENSSTALRITRDFGRETLWTNDRVPLYGRETLLRQLRDEHSLVVDDGGRFVESIDGRREQPEAAQPRAWVTNVNGIETDVYPVDYDIHDGDVVQWDLRDWYVTLDVRATVGAFPQTFTRGVFGRRFPVKVVCGDGTSTACRRVEQTLRDAGVRTDGRLPDGAPPPPRGNPRRARVLVGPWRALREREWPSRIDAGPRFSGVFARFAPDARSLRLLDWNGHRVRTIGAGSGLVAAMRPTEEDLIWLVTGVDDRGVERAATALRPADLRDAFAVAVGADGVEKLPLPPRVDDR